MPSNHKILQVLTGCLVCALSFFLKLPGIAAADFDVTGTWYWAAPGTTTNAAGLPEGRWSGTFTILEDKPGTLTGRFSDSRMEDIKVNGNRITFNRVLSIKDKDGADIQMWSGTIETRKEGGLRIRGTWSGAFDYLPKEVGVSKDFVATKT